MSQTNRPQAIPLVPQPPCRVACPVHTDVQGYIALIAQGEFEQALNLIRETNPFPSICGRVCTHPCESKCRRGEVDQPLAIRLLKRFVAERGNVPRLTAPEIKYDHEIAIIGSGPAGLSAAHDLALLGYKCTVFEALPVAGGMLSVGIPEYRLPRDVLRSEIEAVRKLGVDIKLNTRIGEDLTIADLWEQGYKAIFIAVGAHKSLKLGIPGEDLDGVCHGLSFLRDVNLGKPVEVRRRVAIIGGGNVAIDASRAARRLGAEEVIIFYRRSRAEMPASEEEIEEAEREGVEIHFLASPTKILGGDGKVTGMECIRMRLGAPDASGRKRPIPVAGSEFTMDVDMVIPAIGQAADLSLLPEEFKLIAKGRLEVDPISLATSVPGFFAGGDVVSGPASVIEAIAAGKRAAISIDMYLKGEDLAVSRTEEWLEIGELSQATLGEVKRLERQEVPTLPMDKRLLDFTEVELGFTEGMAVREAQRCLTCGAGAECIAEKCVACLTCVRICPYDVPIIKGGVAWIEAAQCQGCGICAGECPAKAIVVKNYYSDEEMMERIEALLASLALERPEPLVVGFRCRYCAYLEAGSGEATPMQLPANIGMIDVPCAGRIDSSYLLKAFESGADGVFVVGCLDGNCRYNEGDRRAKERVQHVKGLLDAIGLSGERLEIFSLTSATNGLLAQVAMEMLERVRELGPSPLGKGG